MGLGRRCSLGCETWPNTEEYALCPQCGSPTSKFRGVEPLDEEEARSLKLHFEFEKFYEKWCRDREQPLEGPLEEPTEISI
jgi:hypothetical protein